jgi:hypothetical protein
VDVRNFKYRSADKSLARPTSRCVLFDGENISLNATLVIYIKSTNIPPGSSSPLCFMQMGVGGSVKTQLS